MDALSEIKRAGFDVELLGPDKISVAPGSKLSEEQREFLIAHKPEIIRELKNTRKVVAVYRYRHSDYPDQYGVMITPGFTIEQARERLSYRFGKERILEVIDYQLPCRRGT